MELHVYLAFVAATALMIALPGPSVLLTVAHGISHGGRRALATVAGATMGVAVQLALATAGLGALLHNAAEIFAWLRWVGAAYLVYLGVHQWRSAGEPLDFGDSEVPVARVRLFFQGLAVTIPNPKSLVFIAAFLPQFIDVSRSPGRQLIILLPTFLIITFLVTSCWALAAGRAARLLRKKRVVQPFFRAAGGFMVLAGIGLGLARRGS
jgi:threonine/homoserine/homoserine lactone efflux protein